MTWGTVLDGTLIDRDALIDGVLIDKDTVIDRRYFDGPELTIDLLKSADPTLLKQAGLLTQDQVNTIQAEEKRKHKAQNQELLTQLNELRQNTQLSEEQHQALNTRISELEQQTMSAEELRQKALADQKKEYDGKLIKAEDQATYWKSRFSNMMIDNAIIGAASSNEPRAYNPVHIKTLLSGQATLVERKDESGKPTGEFEVVVNNFDTVGEDGQVKRLQGIKVSEAVKLLSKMKEHANLFDSGQVGGIGGNNQGPATPGSGDEVPTDPKKLRAWWSKQNQRNLP